MKVKQKTGPVYALSLTEREAVMLKAYLDHTSYPDHQTGSDVVNEFGWHLWNELHELLHDSPVLD